MHTIDICFPVLGTDMVVRSPPLFMWSAQDWMYFSSKHFSQDQLSKNCIVLFLPVPEKMYSLRSSM